MAQDSGEKTQQDADAAPNGVPAEAEKREKDEQRPDSKQSGQDDGPAGGFDDTPIPRPNSGTIGYTLKFTMLQATNLAMGDAHAFSSDPYILAQLNTDLPVRHKEDPRLRFRTPTVRKNVDPEWNEEWIVANVPSTGFKLKLRVYDEDPADHDDMLGKVHVTVPSIDDNWKGFQNQRYELKLRDSSKRALLVRTVASCLQMVKHIRGELYLGIENLGRTGEDGQNGRVYTVGPCRWMRHYSPILGRLANIKEPGQEDKTESSPADGESQKKVERYNFQANQFQFPGPVPTQLYHRFVEFKPWVRRMFNMSGFSGVILGKALHHQHARVYNFDRSTEWGYFEQGPCKEMTQQFLDLVHYDKGGRIFTYVLNLDGLFRFTETGKEFGIDMLSKHTMHSDVAIYIAFSGEFFIRRIKKYKRISSPKLDRSRSGQGEEDGDPIETNDLSGPAPEATDASTDPSHYELVIDNDSGTYRPNATMLPVLAKYLSQCLPGLHVKTLDCNADADEQQKLKSEQRERKQNEGDHIVYTQASDSSSISSSDEEDLDERVQAAYQEDGTHDTQQQSSLSAPGQGRSGSKKKARSKERNTVETVAKDMKQRQEARMEKAGRSVRRTDRDSVRKSGALREHGPGSSTA